MEKPKTYVYVDGFNLYYGSLKGTEYKWLNLEALVDMYLPQFDVQKIYYFTARVSGAQDPDKPLRQQSYIRALQTLKRVEIIDGHFMVEIMDMPKADGSGLISVIRTKEKRSDVNLACQLMWDASCNKFHTAVIVSGDSDFLTRLIFIKDCYKRTIGVLDPQRSGTPQGALNRKASFYKPIRVGALQASQFQMKMTDSRGDFYKPKEWFPKQPKH